MEAFRRIEGALRFIEGRLNERIGVARIASEFHYSKYYFHRLFTAAIGVPIAAYVRGRRLIKADAMIRETSRTILEIALDCGFQTHESFSRAYRRRYGRAPQEARREGAPYRTGEPIEAIIEAMRERIIGGLMSMPKLIEKGTLRIAGVTGDGSRTMEAWKEYERIADGIPGKLDGNGYEARIYDGSACEVHVGCAVTSASPVAGASIRTLPAGEYASFDVYVEFGYESGNRAMDEWIRTNGIYRERLLDGKNFVVEYYDERFKGNESGSIVEIWVPVERIRD